MKNIKLSIVLITLNSEDIITPALQSVAWADEIIVVDSGSTDKTVSIAKKANAKVFTHTFQNYGKQKQFAVSKASNDWVFILDDDERVSKTLAESIISTLEKPQKTAYYVQRKNYFLGKEVTAHYWDEDVIIRLFNKKMHKVSDQRIHEAVIANTSETGKLHGNLYHLSHRSIEELSKKAHEYAQLDASERFTQNPPKITGWNIISSAFKYFIELYITGGGYKDGTEGLLNALILTYQQRILIRAMIWEKQQMPSLEAMYQMIDGDLAKDRYEA